MALHSSSNVPGWQQQQQQWHAPLRCRPLTGRLRAALPQNNPTTANVAAAQLLGLDTRRTASVLWDLDNVCPASPKASLLPAIQEVKDLLLSMGLKTTPSVTCYANMATTRALGDAFTQQLALAGVVLQEVRPKQQAADVRLSSDAVHLAQAQGAAGCVVLVTNDKGFAPVLAYCTSVGMVTILLTSLPSPKYMPAALPDPRRHQLATVCTAAVPLQRGGVQRSPLPSYAHLWHVLKFEGADGFLEPWMYIRGGWQSG